jgi:ribosomal protein L13E
VRTRRAPPDILRVRSLRPGVIGSTPCSGRGSRGSSPWGAVPLIQRSVCIAEGSTQAEVGRRLGLSKPTIAYHARRLGIPARDDCRRRYDWNEIQRAYDSGMTVRQCAQQFGFALCSWHAAVQRGAIKPRPTRMPISELLVVGRRQTARWHLKRRLLGEGLKINQCEQCGLTEWRGRSPQPSQRQLQRAKAV